MAMAVLAGFVSFVLALPAACGSLMLYSEHIYGDVEVRGPQSILGGMAIAAMLAVLVTVWAFWKSSPKS
jgi:hypothetical protein